MTTTTERINTAATIVNVTSADSDVRIEFDLEERTMSVIYPIEPMTDENTDVWHDTILTDTQRDVLKVVDGVFVDQGLSTPDSWGVDFNWGDDPMYDNDHASITFFLPEDYDLEDDDFEDDDFEDE